MDMERMSFDDIDDLDDDELEQSNTGRFSFWRRKSGKQKFCFILGVLIVVIVAAFFLFIAHQVRQNNDHIIDVDIFPTLEKIVDISDLKASTTTYNGIATVYDKEDPEEVDYYVSYSATVNAGVDFKKIQFSNDDENKIIKAILPDIKIDTNVIIQSLDFMFYDKKANHSSASKEAYKACKADLQVECEENETLINMAKENTEDIVTALLVPIISEYDKGYQVSIEWGQHND